MAEKIEHWADNEQIQIGSVANQGVQWSDEFNRSYSCAGNSETLQLAHRFRRVDKKKSWVVPLRSSKHADSEQKLGGMLPGHKYLPRAGTKEPQGENMDLLLSSRAPVTLAVAG
ncbi:hypothetical protein RRG08_026099 [Elysia crispata]|uniref:Uncharacterized protein n=1 Tax=Elysia crispata TaxID=231223 RepID=A0AAE0YR86_9GAST|nr:hypothetical protein RRG08_026099 [Elysia crispata]